MTCRSSSLAVLSSVVLLAGCLPRDLRNPYDFGEPYAPPAMDDVEVESDSIKLLLVGDAGTCEGHFVKAGDTAIRDASFERAAAHCEEFGCDAVILAGDNLYTFGVPPGGEEDADSCIGRWAWLPTGRHDGSTVRVVGVLGNHDWGMIRLRQKRAAREIRWAYGFSESEPPIPGYYWQRRFFANNTSLRVVGIDSEHMVVRRRESQQSDWLEGLTTSDETWTMVVGHHPRYSQGEHGDAGSFRDFWNIGWRGKRFAQRLDSALVETGAHMYVYGHEHMMQYGQVDGVMHIGAGAVAKVTGGVSRSTAELHVIGGMEEPMPGTFWLELDGTHATLMAIPNEGRVRVEEWDIEDIEPLEEEDLLDDVDAAIEPEQAEPAPAMDPDPVDTTAPEDDEDSQTGAP